MDSSLIKTRDDFHLIINELTLKKGVEIGVGGGRNSSYLLKNSKLELLYGVENWSTHSYRKSKKAIKEKLKTLGERFSLIEESSLNAVSRFEDESLDFVYIDGDHSYRGSYADMVAWYPKVRAGGFFGGHDYIICKRIGVKKAADRFSKDINRSFNITDEINDGEINKSFWIIK
jgi:predicted O-methyltransferase YrrM